MRLFVMPMPIHNKSKYSVKQLLFARLTKNTHSPSNNKGIQKSQTLNLQKHTEQFSSLWTFRHLHQSNQVTFTNVRL